MICFGFRISYLFFMKKGFTLIELLIVIAIASILASLSLLSLSNAQHSGYEQSSLEILLSDLKLQQMKSMSGDTGLTTTTHEPFGIYFQTKAYTLFRGASYNPEDPTNFTVEIEKALTFSSVTIPGSELLFEKGSGEIAGFTEGQNTIVITNEVTGQQITVTLNRYGVVNALTYAQ